MNDNQAKREQESKPDKAMITSIIMLVLSMSIMTGLFIFSNQQSRLINNYTSHIAELRILSQQLSRAASSAVRGNEEAFPLLKETYLTFEQYIDDLHRAQSSIASISSQRNTVNQKIETLYSAWSEMKVETNSILSAQNTVLALHDITNTLNVTIPNLQIEYDEVIEILLEKNNYSDQIAIAQRQPWLAERILKSSVKILESNEDSIMAVESVGRDTTLFGQVLRGMIDGNSDMGINKVNNQQARARLLEIVNIFNFVDSSIDNILRTAPELFAVHSASENIFNQSQFLIQQTSILMDTLSTANTKRNTLDVLIMVSVGLSIIFVILTIVSILLDRKRRLEENRIRKKAQESQIKSNQKAIMRLLDEIADLADGDLTIKTSVTEDLTGAIAGSINVAIEQLRALVSSIKQTAVKVDTTAHKTQKTAQILAKSSEHQSQEIESTTHSVNQMTNSLIKVANRASDSANTADRSVKIAANGVLIVKNTLDNMNTIRKELNKSANQLKQLGEFPKKIEDIIPMIKEISDQSKILSLNASIQASMSAEPSNNFSVIADETQRLTEQVSSTVTTLKNLASIFETSTDGIITSMNQASSKAEHGIQLIHKIESVLGAVEETSDTLSKLTRNIYETAKLQAHSASQISGQMITIREISIQSSSNTKETAESINDLAGMATEIRQRVSSFKLAKTDSE